MRRTRSGSAAKAIQTTRKRRAATIRTRTKAREKQTRFVYLCVIALFIVYCSLFIVLLQAAAKKPKVEEADDGQFLFCLFVFVFRCYYLWLMLEWLNINMNNININTNREWRDRGGEEGAVACGGPEGARRAGEAHARSRQIENQKGLFHALCLFVLCLYLCPDVCVFVYLYSWRAANATTRRRC